ncbi:hypothetical protein GCM10008965_10540 [Methylorubrum aminovorans]|nr:hypothetical protein GCM10025880_61120 [Methylorubrum aminovorans]
MPSGGARLRRVSLLGPRHAWRKSLLRPGSARQTGRRRIALAAFERPARIHAGIEACEIFRRGRCRGEEKQAERAHCSTHRVSHRHVRLPKVVGAVYAPNENGGPEAAASVIKVYDADQYSTVMLEASRPF